MRKKLTEISPDENPPRETDNIEFVSRFTRGVVGLYNCIFRTSKKNGTHTLEKSRKVVRAFAILYALVFALWTLRMLLAPTVLKEIPTAPRCIVGER